MLLALWSPKGGSGTSVLVAASSLVLAGSGGARLADLRGDQPAILGLGSEPPTGLTDWLAAGADTPADALERIAVVAAPGLTLLPAGSADAHGAAPEAGAALAVLLRHGFPTVADLGPADAPALHAIAEVADTTYVVVRGCYLALRRAVRSPQLAATAGAVLVDEPGRSLGPREVADVLSVPVVAEVPLRAAVARAVDAGVLASRMPDVLVRAARRIVDHAGFGREGAAA